MNEIIHLQREMLEFKEKESNLKLYPKPYVLRLDGYHFQKFTECFLKPFDTRVDTSMIRTAADLLTQFNQFTLAYVISDEISLVCPVQPDARIQKVLSLVSSYCAARFNFHLSMQAFEESEQTMKTQAIGGLAHFDARIISYDGRFQCVANIYSRKSLGRANSKAGLGRHILGHTKVAGLPAHTVVDLLQKEAGIEWHTYPEYFKSGAIIKKEKGGNAKIISGAILDCLKLEEAMDFVAEPTLSQKFLYFSDFFNSDFSFTSDCLTRLDPSRKRNAEDLPKLDNAGVEWDGHLNLPAEPENASENQKDLKSPNPNPANPKHEISDPNQEPEAQHRDKRVRVAEGEKVDSEKNANEWLSWLNPDTNTNGGPQTQAEISSAEANAGASSAEPTDAANANAATTQATTTHAATLPATIPHATTATSHATTANLPFQGENVPYEAIYGNKNARVLLNELVSRSEITDVHFTEQSAEGPPNARHFTTLCTVTKGERHFLGRGGGKTKKIAANEAAKVVVLQLHHSKTVAADAARAFFSHLEQV
eukprot:Phypoly_transcript_06813.p1 GENE.Phypoly_transcript_06813~~Phypoly_transcript_06813.p1  ORF type:complete len:561 (+),score=109.58 Phypoly_transcript_06813:72-1685(+)